jgi:GT2 family glycosyltransferase
LFINNDTEVELDFLGKLIQFGNTVPNLGMISPRIQYFDPKGIIQYAGSTELNTFTLRNRSLGYGEVDEGQYNRSYPTAFVHGAAMLVPRSVIARVGTMEDEFFLYYEEYDWCARIKAAGFNIYYCGDSLVYHKESMSVGKLSPLKIFYMTRNRIWFALRNIPVHKVWFTLLFLYGMALPKQLLQFILKNRWDLVRATWRGALFKTSEYENRNRSTKNLQSKETRNGLRGSGTH